MTDFSHVSDEGVRLYLEDGVGDFNSVATQLEYAYKCIEKDMKNGLVPLYALELREEFYDEACNYFSARDLKGVHKALKKFWSV